MIENVITAIILSCEMVLRKIQITTLTSQKVNGKIRSTPCLIVYIKFGMRIDFVSALASLLLISVTYTDNFWTGQSK